MGAILRAKELNIDRVHRGEAGSTVVRSRYGFVEAGPYWAIVRLREVMDGLRRHRIFSVLTSARNRDKPVSI